MAQQKRPKIETIHDNAQIYKRQKELSLKEGGAWAEIDR